MQRQLQMRSTGLLAMVLVGMTGCGIYPIMTEENGRRPHAMGKSDQVLLPWAPRPIHLSEEYGLAYRQAVEGQILNPRASNNLETVPGVSDPRAQQFSLTRYQLMFENPPFSDLKLKSGSKGGSSGGAKKSGGGNKK